MQDSDAPAHVQALSLGERLRRHRIESGLTQEELAERAGLSVRGLSDLERGVRRFPYPDTLERLADVLKIGEQQRAALQHARRQAKSPSGGRPAPEPSPDALPSGMVTFVFTDVEGSTSAWEHDPDAMRAALARHDVLIESLVAQYGGHVVRPRGEGDSRFVVFVRTSDAVAAACAVQRAFVHERWPTPEPVRVRVALHTGEADLRGGDYYGSAVNRCARLRAFAHGGQVVLSGVTADLVRGSLPADTGLRDLGQHRLKDL